MIFERIDHDVVKKNNIIEAPFVGIYQISEYFDDRGWIHANPSKTGIEEETKKIFLKTSNNIEVIERLKNLIISDYEFPIKIVGTRGSGKTYVQNYFFNTETRNLNKENITWFRIDVTKIYAYRHTKIKSIDLEEYLWAQIVYVFFRYSQDGFCQKSQRTYSHDTVLEKVNFDVVLKYFNSNEQKLILKLKNNALNASYSDNSLQGKPLEENKEFVKNVAVKIISEIKKHGKIVLFLDGIDNIDFSHSLKNSILSELSPLLEKNEKYKYFKNIVLTVRTEIETVLDEKYGNASHYSKDFNHRISLEAVSYKEYIEWLCEGLREVLDFKEDHLKSNEDEFHLLAPEYFFDSFTNLARNIQRIVRQQLIELEILNTEDDFDIIKDFYDGDVREFRNSLIASYIYLLDYIKHEKSDIEIQRLINIKPHLVFEALFKNGKRYGASIEDKKLSPPYRNLGFTNLFNPAFLFTEIKVTPLHYAYLIKHMEKEEALDISQLSIFFKELFYEFEFVDDRFVHTTVETLIEYNYLAYATCDRVDGSCENELIVKLTKKAKYALYSTLYNVNIFHSNIFYALIDQRLKNKLHISAYDPDGKKYVEHTLLNTAKYIYFLEDLQNRIFKTVSSKKYEHVKLDFFNSHFIKVYRKYYHLFPQVLQICKNEDVKSVMNRLLENIPETKNKMQKMKDIEVVILISDLRVEIDKRKKIYLLFEFLKEKACMGIVDNKNSPNCFEIFSTFLVNSKAFDRFIWGNENKEDVEKEMEVIEIVRQYNSYIDESGYTDFQEKYHEIKKEIVDAVQRK